MGGAGALRAVTKDRSTAGDTSLGRAPVLQSPPTISLHQREGLTVPAILQCCRLHIQVPIDADSLLLWVRAQGGQQDGGQGDLRAIGELQGKGTPFSMQPDGLDPQV